MVNFSEICIGDKVRLITETDMMMLERTGTQFYYVSEMSQYLGQTMTVRDTFLRGGHPALYFEEDITKDGSFFWVIEFVAEVITAAELPDVTDDELTAFLNDRR